MVQINRIKRVMFLIWMSQVPVGALRVPLGTSKAPTGTEDIQMRNITTVFC